MNEDSMKFRLGKVLYSKDLVNWSEKPFYGPERRATSVVTDVDAETGVITIESLPLYSRQREFLDE
jgi:hypothetical protein